MTVLELINILGGFISTTETEIVKRKEEGLDTVWEEGYVAAMKDLVDYLSEI